MNKPASLAAALFAASALAVAAPDIQPWEPLASASAPSSLRTTRDITLDDAVRIALAQNPDILRAEQEILRTRGVVLEVSAQAYPQVTVDSSFSQEDKKLLEFGGGGATSSSASGGQSTTSGTSGGTSSMGSSGGAAATSASPMTQSWDITVTASQLIYSGGQVAAAIRIARFTQDATIYSLRDVVDTTISDVRKEFYAVLLDRAIITVQEQNIVLLQSQLTDQENRFHAGTVPRFNVLQADVALANARPQLIQARNDYNIAELNLGRTLGITTPDPSGMPPINPVGILTTDEQPPRLPDALALAQQCRPFLKEQRQQILIQVQNIDVALAGYQPTLRVDAGYEVRNNPTSKSLEKTVNGWFYGIDGSWDIWDSGATYGRVKQAKAQLQEAKVTYDDAVRQVTVEVEQAWDQVRESVDTITSQAKAIEEAQEALRLAQERLRAGAGTQLDVLSAQVSLLQSRTTLVQAQYNYNIAMAELDRVTAANTRWQETFHDPLVDRQRAGEGLPTSQPTPAALAAHSRH